MISLKPPQHQIAKCFEILTVVANDSNRMNELTSWKVDTIATDFYDREKSKYKKRDKSKKEDLSRCMHPIELFSKQSVTL